MADEKRAEVVDMETWVAGRLGRYMRGLKEEGIDDPQMVVALLLPYQTYLVSMYVNRTNQSRGEVRQ